VIAAAAERFIILAETPKLVERLGGFSLPLEVSAFAVRATGAAIAKTLQDAGYHGVPSLRGGPELPFQTDNGHLIYDVALERIDDPADLAQRLLKVPGVFETGLFVGLAERAFIGEPDGSVLELKRD